jgi:hypothetical protein
VVDLPSENGLPPESDPPSTTDARLIDCDLTSGVALVRFHARRELPAAPIVPRGWKPERGARMVNAGCNEGGAATLWSTSMLGVNEAAPENSSLKIGPRIECLRAPAPGRAGGGLFSMDGQLAGICEYAVPSTDTGLYVMPDAIYAILERNNLVTPSFDDVTDPASPGAAPPRMPGPISKFYVDDYDRLIDQARDAYVAGHLNEYKSLIARLSARLEDSIEERRAEIKSLEARRADLRGTPDEIFARVYGSSGRQRRGFTGMPGPERTGSPPPHPAAKIHELEQQLDRLRLEIERLKVQQY